MDAGREEREPGTEAEHEVSGEKFDAQAREHERAREERKADAERGERDVAAVEERDDNDGAEVVDDGKRRQENDEADRRTARRERHDAERESDVGRHRDAPAASRRRAEVDGRVQERGHEHAAERGADRQHHRRFRAELAIEELALDFEADDEEEHRHEAVIDPVDKAHLEPPPARADAELGMQQMLIRGPERRICDHKRKNGACQQDHAAPGLPGQKRLERRHQRAEFSFHKGMPPFKGAQHCASKQSGVCLYFMLSSAFVQHALCARFCKIIA